MEAKFLAPTAARPIENAQRTVFAGGYWDGEALVPFSKKQWAAVGADWAQLSQKAAELAVSDFKQVAVRYERNRRNVIEYAELSSALPVVASAVLAPDIGERFAFTMGEVFLIAVPNRSRAFIFPRDGFDLSRYAQLVWREYRETAYPVSMELFEWRRGVLRAAGVFEK